MTTILIANPETLNIAAPILPFVVETGTERIAVWGRIDQVKAWVRENVTDAYIIRTAVC